MEPQEADLTQLQAQAAAFQLSLADGKLQWEVGVGEECELGCLSPPTPWLWVHLMLFASTDGRA